MLIDKANNWLVHLINETIGTMSGKVWSTCRKEKEEWITVNIQSKVTKNKCLHSYLIKAE
jgi:hypothetical protein